MKMIFGFSSLLPLLVMIACGASGTQRSAPAAGAASLRASSASSMIAAAGRQSAGQFVRHDLVSDGSIPADHVDPNLVNAWGITHLPTSPWWVSDNGANVSTLYDGNGVAQFGSPPLVVSITGAGGLPGDPTGVVANATAGFVVSGGGASGPARFLFASEDGTISGWNPAVPPPTPPATRSTHTEVVIDHSSSDPLGGAVYKGLAMATTPLGERLYATDFRGARVEVWDSNFAPVTTSGGFIDPGVPEGFAPFGIQALGDMIVVTYAKQDAQKHDDVAGAHLGFVSAFTTDGAFLRRIASRGKLDSPWGVALAPVTGFGRFSGMLLVGNFGDGHIIGYRLDAPDDGAGDDGSGGGEYLVAHGGPIVIDGLWGLGFGNGGAAGPLEALFFAAGPDGESHGLFGRIDFIPAGTEE